MTKVSIPRPLRLDPGVARLIEALAELNARLDYQRLHRQPKTSK